MTDKHSQDAQTGDRQPQDHPESPTEPQAVDPQDLAVQRGVAHISPAEIHSNPGLTPELINDPGNIRSDLFEDEEEG